MTRASASTQWKSTVITARVLLALAILVAVLALAEPMHC
jgi:hypothetical protein